jgi:hypothetical protein
MNQIFSRSSIASVTVRLFLLVLLFSQGTFSGFAQADRPGLPTADTDLATMIGGCPMFPSNNIWNTPIDTLPIHARSDQWVNSIGRYTGFHMDFGSGMWGGGPIGIPYNVVGSGVPKVPVSFDYDDESDPGPYPIPNNPLMEFGSDHHILIVDNSACKLYELFDASYSGGAWSAGSGAIWDLNSNALRPDTWTSADAAGLPILPGLVRYDEVLSGQINHAIRFTAQNTNRYIWPARHLTSDNNTPQIPPMGARFRLKASVDISGYPAEMQVILNAMKTYGIILADNGSNWYVSGAPDPGWDNDMLHLLDDLTGDDFEAVDTSVLMVDYDSGATGYTISGNVEVAGATLSYTDGVVRTVTSQAGGGYSLRVTSNWTGTVTPSHPCFSFTPASRPYTNVSANQTNQNYTAAPSGICVSSILRSNSNPTNAATVNFAVNFTGAVTGVDAADFAITRTGVTGTAVTNVAGSGASYTVTVNTGSGNGTIRLDVVDNDSIKDASNNPLGGVGAGNGNFASGEVYTIEKTPTSLVNSVLSTSRSVQVGTIATVFNTVLNGGSSTAFGVTLSMASPPAGAFAYQESSCSTNALTGGMNPSLDIPVGQARCYVLFFTPSGAFAATDVHIRAQGSNAVATSLLTGINTWTLRATYSASPDMIALTTTTDLHQVSCSGTKPFAVAMANVGAATGQVTVTADTGTSSLPLSILIQETNPATGVVIGDHILQNVGAGENRTVVVWVTFHGCVSFDPAAHRIFIRFKDAGNNLIGSTSTAVSTNR